MNINMMCKLFGLEYIHFNRGSDFWEITAERNGRKFVQITFDLEFSDGTPKTNSEIEELLKAKVIASILDKVLDHTLGVK